MKKKLKLGLKDVKEILSRDELRKTIGGFGSNTTGAKGYCMYTCTMIVNGHSFAYDSPYPELKCNSSSDCPSKKCDAGSGGSYMVSTSCVN